MKERINSLIELAKGAKSDPLKRSMLISLLCKPASMLVAFFYTPLLLNCLGDEAYGVWATILSVINWINYFDIGIGYGLRNTLTGYLTLDENENATKATSTAYIVLSVISGITLITGLIVINLLDLKRLFNTFIDVRGALLLSFICICINFVIGLSKVQLFATQQAEKVSIMNVMTQVINFCGIWLLIQLGKSDLIWVAAVVGISGVLVNMLYSAGLWRRYDYLKPRIGMYSRDELKNVSGIGIKFFILQINSLILFATDNMIISTIFGPSYVTPYQTTYNAFGLVNGLFAAFLSPLWSKYTAAQKEKNYGWIKKSIFLFDRMLPAIAVILAFGVVVYKPVARVWLRKELVYPPGLIACMAFFFFLLIWSSIYTTVLNGVGEVNMQLILGVISAVLNIPLSIFFGRVCEMGSTGVLLASAICVLIMNILETIQTHTYLNRKIRENGENETT